MDSLPNTWFKLLKLRSQIRATYEETALAVLRDSVAKWKQDKHYRKDRGMLLNKSDWLLKNEIY